MTTTTIEIGTLIDRSPEIRGGRPTIAGTAVTVRRLVSWYIAIPIVVRYRVLGFEESGVRSQDSGFRSQDSGFRS